MKLSCRPRLLPMLVIVLGVAALTKVEVLLSAVSSSRQENGALRPPLISTAIAAPAPEAVATTPPIAVQKDIPASPDPTDVAERKVLEALRARRLELESRESSMAAREQVLQAAEKRLTARLQEMEALQRSLAADAQAKKQQDEVGWRGLVKVYEAMKPRDAAAIFDELDMTVLVSLVARMKEAKASPVIGAMRPDRARELTTELARLRADLPG